MPRNDLPPDTADGAIFFWKAFGITILFGIAVLAAYAIVVALW